MAWFICSLFTNKDIQERHGVKVWKFISHTFRYWWIDEVVMTIPTLTDVTIESPSSYINDRTKDHITWKEDIKSGLLSRLANTCNNLLMSTSLCPWRCSEYLHKCGHVPLDILIQSHLQDCSIKKITK